MRRIRIDFTQDNPCVDGHVLGRIGEHNATELIITPPADIAAHEAVVSYIIAFSVSNMIIHTKPFKKSETVTVPLWKQLTQEPVIGVQLEAYDSDGEFIGKSEYLSGLRFTPSACGDDTPADSDNHDLLSQVVQNTEKSHLHDNKKVLDGFSEKDGAVMYNGKQITGSGTGLSEEQLADLNANTEARHSHENKKTLDRFGVSSDGWTPTFMGGELALAEKIPIPFNHSQIDNALFSPNDLEHFHYFLNAEGLKYFYDTYVNLLDKPTEIETETVEIAEENIYGVVENSQLTLMAFEGIEPEKELVTIELKTLDTEWVDIRDMVNHDGKPYFVNGRKTFMHTEYGFVCFGVVYFPIIKNQFATAAESGALSARITYKI